MAPGSLIAAFNNSPTTRAPGMGEGVLIRSDQPSSHDAGITNSLVYKKDFVEQRRTLNPSPAIFIAI